MAWMCFESQYRLRKEVAQAIECSPTHHFNSFQMQGHRRTRIWNFGLMLEEMRKMSLRTPIAPQHVMHMPQRNHAHALVLEKIQSRQLRRRRTRSAKHGPMAEFERCRLSFVAKRVIMSK